MEETVNIQKMAQDYWNFDIIPPEYYRPLVGKYILDHPEEFKGATPQ